jgi:hypothetical protein
VTSSTEAEFVGAGHAAKIAKYLRSVLSEFGFPQLHPTPLYEDNLAAIAMINDRRPTPHSHHIDIQHFAIQEWRLKGDIVMHHIPGILNAADGAMKALGWTLHSCHARRSMGHYGPPADCLLPTFHPTATGLFVASICSVFLDSGEDTFLTCVFSFHVPFVCFHFLNPSLLYPDPWIRGGCCCTPVTTIAHQSRLLMTQIFFELACIHEYA